MPYLIRPLLFDTYFYIRINVFPLYTLVSLKFLLTLETYFLPPFRLSLPFILM